MGFYCYPFEVSYPSKLNRDHKYKCDTTFDHLVHMYYFDVDLRNLFSRYIYRIEINFRTRLIYTVSNEYKDSSTWFINPYCVSSAYINSFDELVYTKKFKKNNVIKAHHQKYINDRYAPAWKTIEFMTLGNILVLYRALKDEKVKCKIARDYGFSSVRTFENYMEVLRIIRNQCAHNGVLFDISLPRSIANGPAGKMSENKANLYGAFCVLHYMLDRISENRAKDLKSQLEEILDKCSGELRSIIEICSGIKNK